MSDTDDYLYARLQEFIHSGLHVNLDDDDVPRVYWDLIGPLLISTHNACYYIIHQRRYVGTMIAREERRRANQPRMDSSTRSLRDAPPDDA